MNRLRRIFDDGTAFPLTENQPFYAVDHYFRWNQIHNGPKRGKGSDDEEDDERKDEEDGEGFDIGTVDYAQAARSRQEAEQ